MWLKEVDVWICMRENKLKAINVFKYGVVIHFKKEIKANSMLLHSSKLGVMGAC